MQLTSDTFELDADFIAKDYFRDSFGVMVLQQVKQERVVLRAFGKEGFYLNDLPIHASQKELTRSAEYTDFEIYLRPTNDFCSYVLSRAGQLKVLRPQWLVDKVISMHKQALEHYDEP